MVTIQLSLRLTIVTLMGFISRKKKIVDDAFTVKLSAFLINVALPCMVLNSFIGNSVSPSQLKDSLTLMVSTLGLFTIFLFIGQSIYLFMKKSPTGAAIRFSCIFSNTNFYGVPIAQTLYGSQGLFYYLMMIFPLRILFFGFSEVLMSAPDRSQNSLLRLKKLLKQLCTPVMLSIYFGVYLYLSGKKLPAVLASAIADMGGICSTMGIVLCGVSMGKYSFSELFQSKKNFIIPILRALILPLAGLCYIHFLPIDISLKRILVILPTLPAPSFVSAMVMQYNPDAEAEKVAASAIFITTLVSAFASPFWIAVAELFFL